MNALIRKIKFKVEKIVSIHKSKNVTKVIKDKRNQVAAIAVDAKIAVVVAIIILVDHRAITNNKRSIIRFFNNY